MSLPLGAQPALDAYISEALKNNNALKRQQFELDRSLLALKEARTLFLPSVTLLGDYTRAAGGRTIDLPIGDLLNPVYNTLNQLTQTHNFPNVSNQSIMLNPDNYYDVRFRTAMPLINAEVYYNKKIKQQNISLEQAAVNVYKRALVKDVKIAYYKYYQAQQAIAIYNAAMLLLDKNIAVNESLLRNGVRNSTALTRSRAEKEKTGALLDEAGNNEKNAKAYFNFLLNKDLSSDIVMDTAHEVTRQVEPDVALNGGSVEAREELQEIATSKEMYDLNRKMQGAYLVPKVSTFIDLGSQGFDWTLDDRTRYYLFGISLQWNIFAWRQQHYKADEAGIDVRSAAVQYDETEKAFRLQLTESENNYHTAVSNYYSARTQLQWAEKYYGDQFKAYKEGELLYIELLDAQNQLTTAQLQVSLLYANVQIAKADIERSLATFPINQ